MSDLSRQMSAVGKGDHLCLIHRDAADRLSSSVSFIADGLERGERCIWVRDEDSAADVRDALRQGGVDVEEVSSRGAFAVLAATETYLRSGAFHPEDAVAFHAQEADRALGAGFRGLRFTSDMAWALRHDVGGDRLESYEMLLNRFFRGSCASGMCQYGLHGSPAEVIREVLRTHPIVVVGEQVCPNPHYLPPEKVGQDRVEAEVDWMIATIHQTRAAARALEIANRAKADFLSVISHELRTPLSAIIGYAELLEEGISGPVNENQRKQLGRVHASARHLTSLIEDILSYVRLEAGQEEVVVEAFEAGEVVREAADLLRLAAHAKGLDLRCRAPRYLPMSSDRDGVVRILSNLLSNAVKYTDRGHVRLVAEDAEGEVVFRVSDTGRGIAPEELERIFEPFTVGERVDTRGSGGTGLGLGVARRLSLLLGGTITVQSTQGTGSVFTVRLPSRLSPGC